MYDDPAYGDHLEAEVDELDPEGPSAEDLERFGGDTLDCPRCGYEVYDEASVCPRCGEIFESVHRTERKRKWLLVVALVVLAAVAMVFAI